MRTRCGFSPCARQIRATWLWWSPAAPAIRRVLQCVPLGGSSSSVRRHDLRLDLRRDPRSGAAGAGPVLQPGETLGLVPVQPPLHGRQRDAELPGDDPARQAIGRAEDDPGALDAPLRGRAGPNPAFELLAVPGSQPDPSYFGHARKIAYDSPVDHRISPTLHYHLDAVESAGPTDIRVVMNAERL